ncbi:hypothetical protein lerEdw1_018266 [Lerista edwardsae]|nr:hypothetical protein lerEdw1_018266 [Lerista edwardsae]
MINLTAKNHRLPLNDGNSIPVIGLGTYADPRKSVLLQWSNRKEEAICQTTLQLFLKLPEECSLKLKSQHPDLWGSSNQMPKPMWEETKASV